MSDSQLGPGVSPGEILAGKYRVERVLGAGGMGVVVSAHHLQLDERVAIKFLLPQALKNAEAVARFDREARAAVKIKSEHVARIIDVGKLESGAPYMVMEYLEGGDLSGWLQQHGRLPIEQAVEFILQTCEAIAEAHALGIIHRDLKPANLFCVRRADGLLAIKVLDFGISKATGVAASVRDMGMTRTQTMVGSPLYMSPEQMVSSKSVDARTDVWSLGVILYELVTGRTPFEADGLPELVLKIASGPPLPMRHYRPDTPPGLEGIVLRCLEKERENRYPNVAELAMALLEFSPRSRSSVERITRVIHQAGLSASGSVVMPVSVKSVGPSATMASWGHTGSRAKRDRRTLGVLVGIGLVAVLGGGALFAARRNHVAVALPTPVTVSPPPATSTPPASAASQPLQAVEVLAPPAAPSLPANIPSSGPAVPGVRPAPGPHHAASTPTPPSAASHPAAAPAATANCNPPYYIDSAGHRQYKPECL
jgi:serine/threonine-protein kinase